MKVCLTGATGFVGSSLAQKLAAKGVQLRALVRPSSDRQRLDGLSVEWFEGDVTDPDSLRGAFTGVDRVIHAAGMLGKAGVAASVYHKVHVEGTRHVLTEAAAGNVPVLHISSPGVLGPVEGEPADETAPPAPSNPYERSKAAAERVALEYIANGLPVVIVRPEFIYGPGDTHVLGLFRAVKNRTFFHIGNGQNTCHPTYIDDAVAGTISCLEKGRSGEIYHVTGPSPVTFQQLAEAMALAMGVRPPWLKVPKPLAWLAAAGLEFSGQIFGRTPPLSRTGVAFFSENRRFSWQKIHQELGFTPAVDLAEGIQRTVGWYRNQGLL